MPSVKKMLFYLSVKNRTRAKRFVWLCIIVHTIIVVMIFTTMHQNSTKDEHGLLKAVKHVHAMLDKELAAGTNPSDVFVCGESQGGWSLSLTLSIVLSP